MAQTQQAIAGGQFLTIDVGPNEAVQVFGREQLSTALARAAGGANCLSAEVRIEVEDHVDGGKELAIMHLHRIATSAEAIGELVMNISKEDHDRIAGAIRAAEAKTSGEIVCVLAQTSSHATGLPIFWP